MSVSDIITKSDVPDVVEMLGGIVAGEFK